MPDIVGACDQWYRLENLEEAAQALQDACVRAIQNNEARRTEALAFGSLFEGVELMSFNEHGYQFDNHEVFPDLDVPVVRNTCRSIVQTAVAKMTAQDSPLPQFMSNGGEWDTRIKATRLDRLVTAEYELPQGCFANLHELFRHGALLAMSSTGSFAVFYLAGPDGLIAELDDTLTLGIETAGRYGRIVSLVRTAWYNAEELIERYPEFEDEILLNEETNPDGARLENPEILPERGVRVYQGWRSAMGQTVGRQLFVLKDGTVLNPKDEDQEYDRPTPPTAIWHYERSLYGHWGVSLTRSIYQQCQRINEILADVDYAERNSPQGLVLHRKGATKPGDLDQVRGWQIVELTGTGALGDGIEVIAPPKFNSQSVDLLLLHESGAHDTSGISQQHSAAKRSVGTTSGKHENMVAALFTERFADIERRLISMRTTLSARLIVWALQDILETAPDYKRIYARGDYTEEITLADLDLDIDRYTLSIAPVSEDKWSPRARAEKADKWFEAGLLTGGELLQFYQDFDEKARSQLAIAQEQWLERQIDKWLHADSVEYQGPIKWMDLESAARTVAQALLVARTKGLPDERVEHFVNFLDEIQTFMDQASLASATSVTAETDVGTAFPGSTSQPSPASATGGAVPTGTGPVA